jgi:hypothetical protein
VTAWQSRLTKEIFAANPSVFDLGWWALPLEGVDCIAKVSSAGPLKSRLDVVTKSHRATIGAYVINHTSTLQLNQPNTDEPCPHRPSQLLTDATSNLFTNACSKTSATGSFVTTSSVPAPAPFVQNLSAIGTSRPTYHHPSSLFLRISTQRNVHDPRALAAILEKAEEELARKRHPDPYRRAFLKMSLTLMPQLTYTMTLTSAYDRSNVPWRYKVVRLVFPELHGGFCLLIRFVLILAFAGLGTYRERNLPVRVEPLPHH